MSPGHAVRRRLLRRARPLAAREAARAGGWLVLAPHPDDETLGAGALIATLSHGGGHVAVAFLTDGAMSHVGAPGWSPRRIAGVRAREAGAALRVLGLRDAPTLLGWRDAAPLTPGTAAWEASVRRLVALCRRRRLRQVVTSWHGDPHCDHEAAAVLARAVAARIGATPLFTCVWGWTRADLDRRAAGLAARALPAGRWRGAQRRALACHRTQLGGRIAGAAQRFVLPRPMRRLVDASHLLLLEDHDAA